MKVLTATALVLTLPTALLAESHSAMTGDSAMMPSMSSADLANMQGNLIRTRDITGGPIYTVNPADNEGWNPDNMWDTVNAEWKQIGEIEDIVLSRDGDMIGIVAEIGGFLDIGDKHVMIALDDVNLVAVDDATYSYVTRLNEEDFETMQGVDEGFWN
jgi:hypothetical protein